VVLAVFLAAGVAGVALSASITSGPAILGGRWRVLAELAAWALVWAAGVATALRLPTRMSLVLVVGVGLALRIAALGDVPITSDDLYRYTWDARVQEAGINPYLHPPESGELAGLREPWLWPDEEGCADLNRPPGCTRINRPAVPTIYPPLAQTWFAAVAAVAPDGARQITWQVAGLVTEVAVLALLPVALGRWGGDRRWSALYALSPAPVLEIVHNGHVDGLAVALVLGALVVVAPLPRVTPPRFWWQKTARMPANLPPERLDGAWWRLIAGGALLGAAAMVKLFPVVLLLALAGAGSNRRLPALAWGGAGALAVTIAAYLPHVLDVGWRVVGFLPGYLEEEDYVEGGRFLVASALGLPPAVAGVVSAVAVASVAAWVLVRRPSPPVGAATLIGALLLAASPVQPWYAVALLAVATVAVRPWWVAVLVAGYPYFFAIILDHPHTVVLGRVAYGAALIVVVVGAARRVRGHRSMRSRSPARWWSPPAGPGRRCS
jgi:hypothetical protein